ncbi:MAG: hypothetical protein H8K04_08215 [Nitrospira sp.]
MTCMLGIACPSAAIEVDPAHAQIQAALDRGTRAAAHHQPPETFYARFGGADELHAGGFLITKLGALSVMATHMALRGLEPSWADVAQVTQARTMLVNTVIFGDSPSFAVNSYVVLDQGGKVIKPMTMRVDGQASRSAVWPNSPKFRAKVVAAFGYADFDPKAQTTLTVFPATGGEVRFLLDFGQIE